MKMIKSLEEEYNLKPLEFLEKLSTPRLLNLYKIERKKAKSGNYCECCGEFLWKVSCHAHLEKK